MNPIDPIFYSHEGTDGGPTEPKQASADNAQPAPDAPAQQAEEPLVAEVIELDEAGRLRQQLDAQAGRLRLVSKAYTDLQSDMDAFRKRQQATANIKANRKAAEVIEKFFEPVQNLKRMLEAGGDAEVLTSGVTMIVQQFTERMDQLGLREVPGVGSVFDPKVHEALAVMPVADAEQDGKVITVYRAGYVVGDRVLQAAQVVIGKHDAAVAEA